MADALVGTFPYSTISKVPTVHLNVVDAKLGYMECPYHSLQFEVPSIHWDEMLIFASLLKASMFQRLV